MASNPNNAYSSGNVVRKISSGSSSEDKGSDQKILESELRQGVDHPVGSTAEPHGRESVNDSCHENSSENSRGGDVGKSNALQFPSRVMRLTVAQCAVGAVEAAKGNAVAGAAVSAVEKLLALVAIPAAFICGPAAAVCEAPLRGADWLLCKGMDWMEALLPCMFMPPAQVYGAVQSCVGACVCFVPRILAGVASRICPTALDRKLR